MIKPYFTTPDARAVLFHADCRELLPRLPDKVAEAVITDPVWPNALPDFPGSDDPFGLFSFVAHQAARLADRLVVQLGCDSDPRFLRCVPDSLPFIRVCWLEFVRPHYKGRILYTGDIAYVFGRPPSPHDGHTLLPGRTVLTAHQRNPSNHPRPARIEHLRWLVKWFAGDGPVLDPLMGTGATVLAAYEQGLSAIGIDIDSRWCDEATQRLRQMTLRMRLP